MKKLINCIILFSVKNSDVKLSLGPINLDLNLLKKVKLSFDNNNMSSLFKVPIVRIKNENYCHKVSDVSVRT